MRVLVTGGSGFIGSHIVDKLQGYGFTVRVFDLTPNSYRDDIEYFQGSILNMDDIRSALHRVDAVMHLAAIADVKDVFEEPDYAEMVNVRGTINVLEATRKSKVKKLIYGSTVWVYSDVDEETVNENTALKAPSHLYTATKIAGEYYCKAYSSLYGLEVTILRYGVPYGPRARAGAVVPIFVAKALSGEPITIAGDGSQFRRFIYVEDLADGNVLALKPIAKNKIFNLDGTEKVTIRQIAETVKKIIGDVKIEYIEARPGDFSGKEVSSEKALEELGWKPKVSFEEGVRRYIDWYKDEQKIISLQWHSVDTIFK